MTPEQLDQIADDIAEQGYGIYDGFLSASLIADLAIESDDVATQNGFTRAGIGRQQDFTREETIRSDSTHWLDGSASASARFLAEMESLRLGINQRLFLGLFDYEAHFARYAEGAFYKKHLDAFRVNRKAGVNRKLSTVVYLNTEWLDSWGGELVIYAPESDTSAEKEVQRVQPIAGRLVIFLSEEFPHEVLPAVRERKSIAGWFRVNEGKL